MVIKRLLIAIMFLLAHSNPVYANGVVISPTGSGVFAADSGTSSAVSVSGGKPVVNTTASMNTGTLEVQTQANTPTSVVNVYLDNKNTLGSPVNVTLDLAAKFNKGGSYAPPSSQDASNALVVTSFLGNINADVSGYNGLAGKNAGMVCASKIMAGDYGATVKNDFEVRRQNDSSLSLSVCDQADILAVTNYQTPTCSIGSYVASKNGQSSPIFPVKKAIKKRKCQKAVPVGYTCYLQTYNYTCGAYSGLMVGNHTTPKSFNWTVIGMVTRAGNRYATWMNNIYPATKATISSAITNYNGYGTCSDDTAPTVNDFGFGASLTCANGGTAAEVAGYTASSWGGQYLYDYTTGANITGSYANSFRDVTGPFSGYVFSTLNFKSKYAKPMAFFNINTCNTSGGYGTQEGYYIFNNGTREPNGGWRDVYTAPIRVGDAQVEVYDTGSVSVTCSAWKDARPAYNNYEIAQSVIKTQNQVTWVDSEVTTTCPAGTDDLGLSDDWSNNPVDYQNPANQVNVDCAYGTNCGAGVSTSFTSSEQRGEVLRPEAGETGSQGGRVDALVYAFVGNPTATVANGSNGNNGTIDINAAASPKYCADIKNTTADQIKTPILNIEKVNYFPWDLRPVSYSESKTFPSRNQSDYFKVYNGVTEPFRDYLKRVNCPTCPR